jgi:hypothetical protein
MTMIKAMRIATVIRILRILDAHLNPRMTRVNTNNNVLLWI